MTVKDLKKESSSKEEIHEEMKRLKKAAISSCQKGEFQSAFVYTKRLQRLTNETNSKTLEGQAYLLDAQIYFTMGNHKKTLELTKQIIKQFSKIPVVKASCFNIIGLIHLNRGNFSESQKYFKKALRKIKRVENSQTNSYRILCNVSTIYRIQGDFDKSLSTLNKVIELSVKKQDELSLLLAYGNTGNLYLDFLMYKEAIENFQSCIHYAEKISARKHILEALPQLSEALIMLGDYEQAEKEIKKAKTLAEDLGITQLIALTKTISALWLYKAKGDHNGALAIANEVNQLFHTSEEILDYEYLVRNLAVKIMIELDLNLFQEALIDIEDALKIITKSNAIVQTIIFLNLKGLIKSSEFNFKEAQKVLQTAIQLATKHGIKNHLAKTKCNLDLIKNIEKANKAYDVAISTQQKEDKMNLDKVDLLVIIKDYVEYALPKIS